MAATLLFWGWQTGLLPLALILAGLLESSRLVQARWEFTQKDLDRIWNLCTLLFFGVAFYAFASNDGIQVLAGTFSSSVPRPRPEALAQSANSVFLFFQWLPLCFIPMIATQAWGEHQTIPLSTFSYWLRRQRPRGENGHGTRREQLSATDFSRETAGTAQPLAQSAFTERHLNVSYPYLAICLLGASAARARAPWFIAGLLLLLGWALWARRSKDVSAAAWAASLLTAVSLGVFAERGLFYLQGMLQRLDSALMMRFLSGPDLEMKEARTMLGSVGRVKLSGRIVIRIKPGGEPPPALLREASYNLFKSPVWSAAKREFTMLLPEDEEGTWNLAAAQENRAGTGPQARAPAAASTVLFAKHAVQISELLPGGQGVLALPQGVLQLEHLPVFILKRNPLGAVRSAAGPGFVEFKARYEEGASIDAAPGADDLQVPLEEQPALAKIVRELELPEKSPEDRVKALGAFFTEKFEYSSWLAESSRERSALSEFLLRRRKGHCEYFASATTLLLRQAGIPARYAVGYAVQERKGGEYLVRARHAHAWCLAWINGAWREVDNTPASWVAVEAGLASFWEPLSDAWRRLRFAFSKWRWGQSQWRKYLVWFMAVLLAGVLGQLFATKGWRRERHRRLAGSASNSPSGLDSEFYLIENRLAQLGLARRSDETVLRWLGRISSSEIVSTSGLHEVLALHYRLRFDPRGLGAADRASLRARVERWLAEQLG
jgi:hypothetical protein